MPHTYLRLAGKPGFDAVDGLGLYSSLGRLIDPDRSARTLLRYFGSFGVGLCSENSILFGHYDTCLYCADFHSTVNCPCGSGFKTHSVDFHSYFFAFPYYAIYLYGLGTCSYWDYC